MDPRITNIGTHDVLISVEFLTQIYRPSAVVLIKLSIIDPTAIDDQGDENTDEELNDIVLEIELEDGQSAEDALAALFAGKLKKKVDEEE